MVTKSWFERALAQMMLFNACGEGQQYLYCSRAIRLILVPEIYIYLYLRM